MELQHPREGVTAHVVLAQNLGQPALSVPPPHLELPHPVLGHHESLGEEEIGGVLRVDVGHAEPVADDLHRLVRARDLDHPVDLREDGPSRHGGIGRALRVGGGGKGAGEEQGPESGWSHPWKSLRGEASQALARARPASSSSRSSPIGSSLSRGTTA